MHAAVGIEQLKKLPWMTERRNFIVARYNELLDLKRTGNHLYPVLVKERTRFINYMKKKGIQCSVHFIPLHKMTAYQRFYKNENMANTNYLGDTMVSLPLYPTLTEKEVDYIAKTTKQSKLLINE